MRKKLTIFAILTSAILAIATGIADIFGKSETLCATSACTKVHSSSIATAFVIPIGFYAAAFLLLTLWLYLKARARLSSVVLCGLLGVEAYFTFVEIVFINSICSICLIFFGLLITCAILAQVKKSKNAMLAGFMLFFITHFVFFFPTVTLKPTLTRDISENKSVEIFSSPSCSHCEAALEDLRKVCTATGTPLIVRPVAISKRDVDKSIKWVRGKLFECKSPTSYRLAEKIVWENESEARNLNDGKLAVPLILVRVDGFREIYRGWNKEVKESINGLLAAVGGIGRVEAEDVIHETPFTIEGRSSPKGLSPITGMCTGAPECND